MSSRRGHGEGSVYQRASDGRWVGVFDLGWHDGKRKRRTVYGSTRAEVVKELTALRRAHENGLDLLARPRTLGEWLDEWLTEIKAVDGTRQSTLARYRGVVDNQIKPGLGRLRLEKVAPRDVQRFLASLGESLSTASVTKVHGVLRVALSDAERMDLVVRNVAKSVRPPAIKMQERRSLTVQEAQRFLEVVEPDRLEGVFVLCLTLGLRRGEVLGLRWDDIDPARRTLTVARSLQRVGGELRMVEPKTARSRRVLPLSELALRALERQRVRQAGERLKAEVWRDSGLLFASTIGTPLEPRNVNRRFEELRDRAGLPWLRLHDLRHGCATFLLAQGVEPRTVMEVLGHSTYRLTMDLYGHVLPERMHAAAEQMDRALERLA